MTTPMVALKPLMLKEYLELDHDDDDGLVLGGGDVVTVRSLLDGELRKKTAGRSAAVQDAETANGNALGKFSAVIEAVKRRCLQAARSERTAFSVLSWKRKKQRPEAELKSATVEDATWANPVRWQPLRFVSPVAASPVLAYDPATASGETKKEYSSSPSSSSQPSENEEEEATIASTTATPSPATEVDGKVGPGPVLILKEDEEEEEFYRSLDSIERTTEQLLHRIRRFEMLAELDHAAECCSRSSDGEYEEEEEEEERAWELLGRLKANPPPRGGEKLLLDFFIQGGKAGGVVISLRQRLRQGATTTTEMLCSARRWIDGRLRGEAEQHSGHGEAATLREMEKDGHWRCFHEEEEELGLQVGDEMLQSLVEELVKELA
ncbi:uncharacterized protein LOC122041431 [Zingiber officinale]|uniref:DUF4378 domain-containing protein n=1 Tax=Zingiber officinale TaxID=94328 RepID=A0A8J5I5D8_ZINOF|nr:uncharacterized protein LOC122041431 [Zingiber officinale]KAG6528190.1 hypothetical protein ZIOFF_010340 [Zingiber officinale]